MTPAAASKLIQSLRHHDRRALATCISQLETGGGVAQIIIQALPTTPPSGQIIGVTGAPGVGKSTLINALIHTWRNAGEQVAVLAIDPTSPLSGGAILGDRIRMAEHSGDKAVFIRSLASRGNPAGLTLALPSIIKCLELFGMLRVLVETVGSGQLDTLIPAYVQTTLLLLSPEGGDEIQMMKAGILEIADIMVINKSDRPGVEILANQLQAWIDLMPKQRSWRPPLVKVQANATSGISELIAAIAKHQDAIKLGSAKDQEQHHQFLALSLATSLFRSECAELLKTNKKLKQLIKDSTDAVALTQELLKQFRNL